MPDLQLYELPKDPRPGLNVILEYAKADTGVSTIEAGHGALHILSYGYGLIDPHDEVTKAKFTSAKQAADSCPDDVKQCCKQAAKVIEEDQKLKKGLSDINWVALLPLLIQIVKLVFAEQKS